MTSGVVFFCGDKSVPDKYKQVYLNVILKLIEF